MDDFDQALNVFINKLQEQIIEKYTKKFPNVKPDKVNFSFGKNFVKIIIERDSGGQSAHCFVVLKDNKTKGLGQVKRGDILKAATWKAPARHVRGTIFSETFEGYGVDIYGAKYL